jgi:hypothetical protein
MKKLIVAFILILSTISCDDGELIIENFNFGSAVPVTCNAGQTGFFVYKTNGKEVIILKIDENKFLNPTVATQTIEISGSTEVIYRIYSDNISSSFLCTSPPPTSPTVVEEWKAISGTITILSNATGTEDTASNATRISGFNHEINIKNLNFKKPDGSEQLFTSFNFGAYKNTFLPFPTSFGADGSFGICIISGNLEKLSKVTGTQSLVLEAPSIFANNDNDLNITKSYFIDNNFIKLNYNLYKETVSTSGICASSTPTVLQTWTGQTSTANTNGVIKVYKEKVINSSNVHTGYIYTVTLSNVIFNRQNFSFKSGNNYIFGTFTRNL